MESLVFPLSPKEAEKAGVPFSSEQNRNALFPTRLRSLRNDKGISQAQLSEEIGVTKSTVSLYETGDNVPDIKTFSKICDYFNVSYDYLLGKSENAERENTDIGEKLGLSDNAIANIKNLYEKSKHAATPSYPMAFTEMAALNAFTESKTLPQLFYKAAVLLVQHAKIEYQKEHIAQYDETNLKSYIQQTSEVFGLNGAGTDGLTKEGLDQMGTACNTTAIMLAEDRYKYFLWKLQQSMDNILVDSIKTLYVENKEQITSFLEKKKEVQGDGDDSETR